jgi:hypothetical protein
LTRHAISKRIIYEFLCEFLCGFHTLVIYILVGIHTSVNVRLDIGLVHVVGLEVKLGIGLVNVSARVT